MRTETLRKSGPAKSGFTLLEIMLALAILGGSLAILSRIVETGTSAAIEARALSEARLVCQAKLSEVMLDAAAGVTPQSVATVPLESFDSTTVNSMNYSVDVAPGPIDGLLVMRVTVQVQPNPGATPIASYSLTRWMIDPTLGLEQLEAEEQAALAGDLEAEL